MSFPAGILPKIVCLTVCAFTLAFPLVGGLFAEPRLGPESSRRESFENPFLIKLHYGWQDNLWDRGYGFEILPVSFFEEISEVLKTDYLLLPEILFLHPETHSYRLETLRLFSAEYDILGENMGVFSSLYLDRQRFINNRNPLISVIRGGLYDRYKISDNISMIFYPELTLQLSSEFKDNYTLGLGLGSGIEFELHQKLSMEFLGDIERYFNGDIHSRYSAKSLLIWRYYKGVFVEIYGLKKQEYHNNAAEFGVELAVNF